MQQQYHQTQQHLDLNQQKNQQQQAHQQRNNPQQSYLNGVVNLNNSMPNNLWGGSMPINGAVTPDPNNPFDSMI